MRKATRNLLVAGAALLAGAALGPVPARADPPPPGGTVTTITGVWDWGPGMPPPPGAGMPMNPPHILIIAVGDDDWLLHVVDQVTKALKDGHPGGAAIPETPPATTEPAPVTTEPTPAATEPAPVTTIPAPTATELTPATAEPVTAPVQTAPAVTAPVVGGTETAPTATGGVPVVVS